MPKRTQHCLFGGTLFSVLPHLIFNSFVTFSTPQVIYLVFASQCHLLLHLVYSEFLLPCLPDHPRLIFPALSKENCSTKMAGEYSIDDVADDPLGDLNASINPI